MKICKIESTFCKDDQVQITFNNAPTQLICSKDGYLYYRFNDLTIHRYVTNPRRFNMKHSHPPFSHKHATHFFKFNQPYIFFTPYDTPDVSYNFTEDTYHMRFLYFTKLPNGDVIYAETSSYEFQSKETKIMTLEEVKKFLYDTEGVDGKYIVDWNYGVKYAATPHESIILNNYVDLSYESIVKHYNDIQKIVGHKTVDSIDEIKEALITTPSLGYNPMLVTISGTDILITSFSITCHGRDNFKAELRHYKIDWDLKSLDQIDDNLPYTDTFKLFF